MKTSPLHPFKMSAVLVVFVLIISSLVSCQSKAQVTPAPVDKPSAGAQLPAAPETSAEPTIGSRPENLPQGGYDLSNPPLGLDTLSSFHQNYTMTLKGTLHGDPYEESQRIEREVVDQDESIQVTGDTTFSEPVYGFNAWLDNYHYAQGQENTACQAEPAQADKAMDLNPALRLPAAFGIQEAGREEWNNQKAVHYTFNEKSLVDPEDVLKKAVGAVWLAVDSGILLKYELTVEISSNDFSGTRSWTYQLDRVNQSFPIRLPAACQPVLADLPALPGAADILILPGFQQYRVEAGRSEAVAFYYNQLTGQGWNALPGSSPETAELTLPGTVLSFSRGYLEGGQILVVQIMDLDGLLQVTAQTVNTKMPVQWSEENAAAPLSEESEVVSEPDSDNASSGMLPADLPLYPGAAILTQIEGAMMLETQSPAADVVDFYIEALEDFGWSIDRKVENAGMTALMASRNGDSLLVSIQVNGDVTQVSITAIAE